jgi:hypothetical protein
MWAKEPRLVNAAETSQEAYAAVHLAVVLIQSF